MRKSVAALVPSLLSLGVGPTVAWAQDAPPMAPEAPMEAAPAPEAPPPAAEPAPAPMAAEPAPAEPMPAAPMPAAPMPAPAPMPEEAAGEEEGPPPATISSGYVETAYHMSLTNPNTGAPMVVRAYDGANDFVFHAAHLSVTHSLNDMVSMTVDLDAGYDAAVNNSVAFPGAPSFVDPQEAYATFTNSGFTLTAGRFATYEGIELIEGPTNPTVTRGLLYFFAEPVTHAGVKAHYAIGPADIGVGLVNGWDQIFADNNNFKTLIWRLGISPSDMFFAGLSGTWGEEIPGSDEKRLSVDLTGGIVPNDMIAINFQVNYGEDPNSDANGDNAAWFGFGIQPVLTVQDFSIGARFEYFADGSDYRVASGAVDDNGDPADVNYMNVTITPGYTLGGGFRLRGEFRLDTASEDVFIKENGDPTGSQSSFAVAADYQF